jgi:hypothetical protein
MEEQWFRKKCRFDVLILRAHGICIPEAASPAKIIHQLNEWTNDHGKANQFTLHYQTETF